MPALRRSAWLEHAARRVARPLHLRHSDFRTLALLLSFSLTIVPSAALEYLNNEQLARQLQTLADSRPSLARLHSVAKSAGNETVWLLELGSGPDEKRRSNPALLLVAGIEGNDLAGTVSAVAWAERLASGFENDPAIRKLLETTTLYIFPRLNPEAAARFFLQPRLETTVNSRPTDDDHDGLVDEDGPEDLNGDGLVTSMRVEDPEGEYMLDPAEPRLLIKAEKARGEVGTWRLLSEGRDNDHDEQFNEDGPGGVNLNRNFPFDYKFFATDAGINQVSEPETRALADFVVDHPNIGIVFTFGAADNLMQTPKADEKSEKIEGIGDTHRGGRKPAKGIHNDDVPFFRELGKTYRDLAGLTKELHAIREPGTFSDWMYFHRGRFSLAAQPWSPSFQLELMKAQREEPGREQKKENDAKSEHSEAKTDAKMDGQRNSKNDAKPKPDADKRNDEERAFLKWLDASAPGAFVPWQEIQHPDFPGKKVEVGGFAPFARSNPPVTLLDDLTAKHSRFLTELAQKFPRIGIRKAEAKSLGESVYELTVRIENTGYLPTALAQGVLTREVLPTRVVLKLEDAAILSGKRITLLGAIEGSGGSRELRYVVLIKDAKSVEIEVISQLGGTASKVVDLPGP